jgi:hypothetical protein
VGTVNSESDVQEQGKMLPLMRFLLQWDRRLATIAFGDGQAEPRNWRNVLFKETSRMTEASARGLAMRMLDPKKKLTPHEVFLFAFWTLLETPERMYRALLQEHRARFFNNIFGPSPVAEPTVPGVVSQPSLPADDERRVFRLRTRGRLLNVADLRAGFAYRFPDYRCLVQGTSNAGVLQDVHAMKIAVLCAQPDVTGSHTLSDPAQADVHRFLSETTSVYANVEASFDMRFDRAEVDFEWGEGVNERAAKVRIEEDFQKWTWTRWQFKPWAFLALENEVHAYLLAQTEMKNIHVRLSRSATHSGLLTLALNAKNQKEAS